jgi:hypothetical protein
VSGLILALRLNTEEEIATEHPTMCLVCKQIAVTYPAVVCRKCVGTPAAAKAMRRYRRSRRPKGSVRTVTGGLPSLGGRR